MTQTKPTTIADYKKWMQDELKQEFSPKVSSHYNSISPKMKIDFENSQFWRDIQLQLDEFNNEYLLSTGYPLMTAHFSPVIVTKPYESLLNKTFRKNILLNKSWPDPPNGGWIIPDNWFEKINDILRTYFVVKYLDGVEFLTNKIQSLAKTNGLGFEPVYEAREEGYYAVHLYIKTKLEIPKMDWDTEFKDITIEIQITTQLQDVITKLTHKFYEQRRLQANPASIKWQWDYESDDFLANYLGHILHYLEGMIMEVRNKQKGTTK